MQRLPTRRVGLAQTGQTGSVNRRAAGGCVRRRQCAHRWFTCGAERWQLLLADLVWRMSQKVVFVTARCIVWACCAGVSIVSRCLPSCRLFWECRSTQCRSAALCVNVSRSYHRLPCRWLASPSVALPSLALSLVVLPSVASLLTSMPLVALLLRCSASGCMSLTLT
jgi:hypothetical protein